MKLRLLENLYPSPWAWHFLILKVYSEIDGDIDKWYRFYIVQWNLSISGRSAQPTFSTWLMYDAIKSCTGKIHSKGKKN